MPNTLVVCSLGGSGFCINGNLFRTFALQNQEASVPIPYSNMEAWGQSPANQATSTNHDLGLPRDGHSVCNWL